MKAFLRRYAHEIVLAVLLIAVFAVAGSLEPLFVRPAKQLQLASDAWPLALLALPMTLIILTGGIDLSVGSTTALCAVVLGLLVRAGVSAPIAAGVCLLIGATAGALNGLLIAWLRVHPLIVTLATLNAFRGIALAVGGGEAIDGFPPGWRTLAGGAALGLPLPLWLIGTLAIALAVFLAGTAYGRFVYAIGHNATAARYSGVPVQAMRFWLFTFSGLCAGVTAILITSRYNSAKADFAASLELQVITAVVLGGVSIFGGRGNIGGVVLGVVLIHVTQQFVTWHWSRSDLNALVVGGLLIGSVLVNTPFTGSKRSNS